MDMDFNGDMASLDAEILQLPEVSPLGIKTNPHVAEKLFDQWLSLLDTVSLDDGILVIPIVADSPPKLRTKKGLAVEFHDRVYALLTIATMSGGCQVDTMIIQAISLLDDLEKELNKYAMGVREWYGWHFPELTKIVQDNIIYAKTVKLMGNRTKAAKLDFSEIEI